MKPSNASYQAKIPYRIINQRTEGDWKIILHLTSFLHLINFLQEFEKLHVFT